ncbi:MAG: hypothetical protein JO227_01330 [Acetobacteraceae bacterium]|nr:hypothetical protein [Acetobacteraceae bacterium]
MTSAEWLTGWPGRLLALLMTLGLLALLIFGVAAPLAGWYQSRAELLQERQALAARMTALAAMLPAIQQRATANTAGAGRITFEGATDAVAAAALQEAMQAKASAAGVTLTSVEVLPPETSGDWHRIGLRVALTATWPVVVQLLQSIDQSRPPMLIDDLHVHNSSPAARPAALPLATTLNVFAFRSAKS